MKLPRGIPRPTPAAIYRQALLEASARVRLMLQLGGVLGMRRGEIAQARREHVEADLVGYSMRVRGKGGHVRRIPLPSPVESDLLPRLLEMPTGPLFTSTFTGEQLTPAYVGTLISRAMPDGWTCHTLRHRCATVAYAVERDLRAVQELLGHSKADTTAIYTQVPADAIRRAISATAA